MSELGRGKAWEKKANPVKKARRAAAAFSTGPKRKIHAFRKQFLVALECVVPFFSLYRYALFQLTPCLLVWFSVLFYNAYLS